MTTVTAYVTYIMKKDSPAHLHSPILPHHSGSSHLLFHVSLHNIINICLHFMIRRLGYIVDLEERRGKDEQRVDESLHLWIYKVTKILL